jgi:hypothetical protein
MKRSSFIRNIALLGAGASLTPWKLAAKSVTTHRVDLPPASVHVPHGNFAEATETWVHIPEMDVELRVESFSRNGIEHHADDLQVFHVRRKDQLMIISCKNDCWKSVGQIENLSFTTETPLELRNGQFKVELEPSSSYLSLSRVV